ncbi:hypothetical protein [Maricaulis sp.]|uniref:hypothetical protein n=1 Tax=Maricaulis sp. TaxID=1486257 RepID=UPI003A929DAC
MQALSMALEVMENGQVARVRLYGDNGFEVSLKNADAISAFVTVRGFRALIIDWNGCEMLQGVQQFRSVAEQFIATLPPATIFIVLHRPAQLSHAMFLTKALYRAGFPARAFQSEIDCLAWLADNRELPITEDPN